MRRRTLSGRVVTLVVSEVLSGSTLAGGAMIVVAALLVGVLADVDSFTAGWADPLNLALTSCAFLGPVACGSAAWRASVLHREGMLSLADTTPRGRAAVLVIVAVATWAWSLLAYAVVLALLVTGIGLAGGGSAAMSMLAVQASLLLLLLTLVGVAVGARTTGARMPRTLVPPGLALLLFAALNAVDLVEGPVGRLSPIYADIFYRYRLEPNLPLLVAVTAALVAVILALAATALRGRKQVSRPGSLAGRRSAILLLVIVAVAGSATAFSTAPAGDTRLRSGGAGSCRSAHGVQLCVWPGPGVPVEASLTALVRARDVARTVLPVPSSFHEPGLAAAPESRVFDVPAGAGAGFAALVAMVPPACDAASQSAADDLTGLLAQRLAPGSVDPRGPWAAGLPVAERPLSEQRTWSAPRVEQLAECRADG